MSAAICSSGKPYVYNFEVKFYPTEPENMREDFTK